MAWWTRLGAQIIVRLIAHVRERLEKATTPDKIDVVARAFFRRCGDVAGIDSEWNCGRVLRR